MSKSPAAPHRSKPLKSAPPVDGLTVGWVTTLITTFVCELGAVAARLYVQYVDAEAKLIGMFSGLLLFAAAVVGVFLLVLTPIVVYRKRSHPPRGIVVFAVVVGVAPWIGMILQAQG